MNYGKKREQMLQPDDRRATRAIDFNARFAAMRETRAAVVRESVAAPRASPRSPPRSGTPRPTAGAEALAAVGEPLPGDAPGGRIPDGDARPARRRRSTRAFDTRGARRRRRRRQEGGRQGGRRVRRRGRRDPDEATPTRLPTRYI